MAIGGRIRQARKAAQLSMRDLAAEAGVSAMAISKYERDLMTPSSEVLLALARALDMRVEYFLRPLELNVQPIAFRKHSKLGVKDQEAVVARVSEWLERYIEAEQLFPQEIPRLEFRSQVGSLEDVERAAEELRDAWHLGRDAIDNMVHLLEDQGVGVHMVEGYPRFDSCIFRINGLRAIAVKKGIPGDRQRFDLAHELGHLLLEVSTIKEEDAANRFAGAFLVPQSAALAELGRRRTKLSLQELALLKHKYGMSIQAWIYRAKDLGIISPSRAQAYWKELRSRGLHIQEPGDQIEPERPVRLQMLVYRALVEDLISRSRAEELLGEPLSEVMGASSEGGGFALGTNS